MRTIALAFSFCATVAILNSVSFAEESSGASPAGMPSVARSGVSTVNSTTPSGIGDLDLNCGSCLSGGSAGGEFCCDPRPRLLVTAEALFLNLDSGTSDAVPIVINQDTGATLITTRDLDFDTVAGPRLGIGYWFNDCGGIEASYFGLHHWTASAEALGDNNLRLPGDLPLATLDFFDADQMRVSYGSELHNVEVNYLRRTGYDNLSLLVGFRYLNLDESFNINAGDIDTGRSSDYNIQAWNHLWGAQLGSRWRKDFDRFGLDIVGKAGIFGNAAKQHTFVGDFDNTFVMRDSTAERSPTAFVGELGFSGTYRLTKALYARAGYNLLWVEGIARAPAQLDFTDTPESGLAVVSSKGAFLHGANVGLEARW